MRKARPSCTTSAIATLSAIARTASSEIKTNDIIQGLWHPRPQRTPHGPQWPERHPLAPWTASDFRARCQRAFRELRARMDLPSRPPPDWGHVSAFLQRADVERITDPRDVATDEQRRAIHSAVTEYAIQLSLEANYKSLGATYHEIQAEVPHLRSAMPAGWYPMERGIDLLRPLRLRQVP